MAKLSTFQVTNFRNIHDSGWIELQAVAVDAVLRARGYTGLDKSRVLGELLKIFDEWTQVKDLPTDLKRKASALFKKIRDAFTPEPA